MYSQTLIHNLKIVRQSLLDVEGKDSETYKMIEEIMEEIQDNLNAFAVVYWKPHDLKELAQAFDIKL